MTDQESDSSNATRRISRRDFIVAAGGGAPLAVAAATAVAFPASQAHAKGHWDHEADIVVVGTGAAGCAAALFAAEAGAKVLMLEKGPGFGGTTALSGGIQWVCNNPLMKAQGLSDSRDDAIRFLCRTAYADQYQPNAPQYGLTQNEYELLETFYDQGTPTFEKLIAMGDLQVLPWVDWQGENFPDYYDIPENKAPRGRAMVCKSRADGKPAPRGAELIGQLKAGLDRRGVQSLMRHRATRLVLNHARQVIGLEATVDGKTVSVRARKAVIFASGGFTHNRELTNQLRGRVFSGCGPLTNEGDFVAIGGAVGAKLSNMENAWWHPQMLEAALKTTATGLTSGNSTGDSMINVNKYGLRVFNEKVRYPDRGQVHFFWDATKKEYKNLLMFMIFDQRTRELGAQDSPVPSIKASPSWLLSAPTLDELARVIDARLAQLAEQGQQINVRLDPTFIDNLKQTIVRFNQFAETGVDLDFHRGEALVDISGNGPRKPGNDKPNPTMYPISDKGPYYCIMLCGGTLDTKGGPKINVKAQVLDWSDQPLVGLYGAGNCIGSPAGQAYWGAGSTIGPAMVFGAIAARNAVAEPVKLERPA